MLNQISRRRLIALAAGTVAAAPLRSFAQDKPLRLVASGAFPPYNAKGPNNEIVGVYAEAMVELFGALGRKVEYQAYPWARGQAMVKSGEADGFITNPTTDRRAYALFAAAPLVEVDLGVLIYRRDSPYAQTVMQATKLEDLRNLPTADYIGNAWGDAIWGEWPNVVRTADTAGIIRLLDGDRIAYAVKNTTMFMRRAEQLGLANRFAARTVDFIPNARNRFHLGLRASLPGVKDLMAAYEAAQAKFIADGRIDQLMLKFA